MAWLVGHKGEKRFDCLGERYNQEPVNRNLTGSLTVEAAMALPLFILVVSSLLTIIQLADIHLRMQRALMFVTYETSQYITVYSHSGCEESMEKTLSFAFRLLSNLIDDADDTTLIGEKHFWENSKAVDFIGSLMEGRIQTIWVNEVFRGMIKKYFESVAKPGTACLANWIVGGVDGLDFSLSEILKDDRSLRLVAGYSVKPKAWIGMPIKINMTNSVMVIPWKKGYSEGDLKPTLLNPWVELEPIARGNYIIEQETNKILREYKDKEIVVQNTTAFKVGILYGSATVFENIINIRSIDYTLVSYKKTEDFVEAVCKEISAVASFYVYKDKENARLLKADGMTKRTLVLVLPEGKIRPEKGIERCLTYAKDLHVNLIVRYAYGLPKNETGVPKDESPGNDEGTNIGNAYQK